MKVGRFDVAPPDGNEKAEHDELQQHHCRIHRGALANTDHENNGDNRHDCERQNVKYDRNTENMWSPVEESGNAGGGAIVRGHPIGNRDAESGDQRFEIIAPTDGDGNVADGIFNDQVPTNDPRNQFAERRIGVRVCAAGNGDHRCELRVAQCGKSARNGCEDKRQD